MADISKIILPSGNTYNIKDAYARQLLMGGLIFQICWDGTSTPVIADIPAGVTVTYNDVTYTGTKTASTAEPMTFYLVKEKNNVYSEYVAVRSGEGTTLSPYTYAWEKLGDTSLDLSDLGNLAYSNNVTLSKGDGDQVLGESTTFTAASSSVTFAGGSTKKVLGSSATFTTSVTPSTKYIKATATDTAVSSSSDTFIKSYPGTTSKLVTTSVPNVTNAGTASTWSFALGTGNEAETLIISGSNGSAPTIGTAITAATGALANDGGGSSVMTGLGTATTGNALTAASIGTQPTVTISESANSSDFQVVVGITSSSTTTNDKDETTAITNIGTGTAAAQTITVGTNDKVKVAKYNDLSVTVS